MGVALVTGAGRGLGAGIARRLAADGWRVAVNDVDTAAAVAYLASPDAAFVTGQCLTVNGGHTLAR